jgi:hypothetical protein
MLIERRSVGGLPAVLDRLYAGVNARDAKTVADCCTENIVWQDPAASLGEDGRATFAGTLQ